MKKKHFHDKQAEIELLKLAAHGIDVNLAPSVTDFNNILANLKSRKLSVFFKWFWKHSDVHEFSQKYTNRINPDDISWYLSKLIEVTTHRNSLHWVERINLFHTFGLCRFFGNKRGLQIIESIPGIKRRMNKINSLSDLSASNVTLMLKESNTLDSIKLIDHIPDRSLLKVYSAYQVYYYGGFNNLLSVLRDYKNSPKQVIIPQTIAGLFLSEPTSIIIAKNSRERIYDEILNNMPQKVVHSLEKLDKKYAISIEP